MRNIMIIGVLAIGLFAAKCHDGCTVEEMVCDDGRSMVCNSNQDWELIADCGGIEPAGALACCVDPLDGLASCLPVSVCESFSAGADSE